MRRLKNSGHEEVNIVNMVIMSLQLSDITATEEAIIIELSKASNIFVGSTAANSPVGVIS